MRRVITLLLLSVGMLVFASEGEVIWKRWVLAPTASSPAVDSDGVIYTGTDGGYLYAVNPDGSIRWIYETYNWGKVHSSPAVDSQGMIYFGCNNRKVYALYPNGERYWYFETNSPVYSSPALGHNGIIYVASGSLYALYPDGTLKWSYPTPYAYSSPAVGADGAIYLGNRGYLYCFNPEGTLRWECPLGEEEEWVSSSPAIAEDGTVYIGTNDGYLNAVSHDGSLKWRYKLGENNQGHLTWVRSSPTIGPGGRVYIGTAQMEALDSTEIEYGNLFSLTSEGDLIWKYRTGGWIRSSATVGKDSVIYFGTGPEGSGENYLYALNHDGSLRWRYCIPPGIRSSPNITSEGTLYVGTNDEYVYAFEVSSPGLLAASSWPKFRHGTPNRGRTDEVYLTAYFDAEPRQGCAPLSVQFADQSVGNPTSWHWFFGDGGESDAQHPTHVYDSSGVYSVTLEVTNDTTADTCTKAEYITARTLPDAEFTAEPREGPSPLTVSFTDQSSGLPTWWKWDFGDGNTSEDENPEHTYSSRVSQSYTVTLITGNQCGEDTLTKTDYISILTPEIEVRPACLSKELGQGEMDTSLFTVSNKGECMLEFETWVSGEGASRWLEVKPDNGEVAPGESETAMVMFDARDLELGIHLGRVMFSSNDEDKDPVDVSCTLKVVGSGVAGQSEVPSRFILSRITPNPVASQARVSISYGLPKSCPSSISLYDLNGRMVKNLVDGFQPAGYHDVIWDMKDTKNRNVGAGIYFLRMKASDVSLSRKLVVLARFRGRHQGP